MPRMVPMEKILMSLLVIILLASIDGLPLKEQNMLDSNQLQEIQNDVLHTVSYDRQAEIAPAYSIVQGNSRLLQRFPSPLMNTLLWKLSVESDEENCPEEQSVLVSLNGHFAVCVTIPEASHMRNRRGLGKESFSSQSNLDEVESNLSNQKRSRLSINGALTSLAGMLQSNARRHPVNSAENTNRGLLLQKILSIG